MTNIVEISSQKFMDCFKVYSIYSPHSKPKTTYRLLCVDDNMKEFIENGMKCFTTLEIIFSLDDFNDLDTFSFCEKMIPQSLINDWRFFEFDTEEEAFYFKLKFC